MAGADAVAAVVEHGRGGRGGDLAGLFVGELAGRVVGRDIGESEALHESAGGDADDVRGGQAFAAAPSDDVDDAQVRMDTLYAFAVEEAAGFDRLVERGQDDVGVSEQAVEQVPGSGGVEVEREAALAGVVEQVAQSALEILLVVEVRAVDPQGVARCGLDTDDVGAEVGEPARTQAETLVAQVDDDRAGEREVGDGHQSRLGS